MIQKKGLTSNALKLIALSAMTIDHLAWTFFPGYGTQPYLLLLHIIGRLTAPIMCYFVAEGYHYTHNIKKYAARLFVLAVISHFAYNFAFGHSFIPFSDGEFLNQTGVIWALFWGLIALAVNDSKKLKTAVKIPLIVIFCAVSFCADWSCIAVLIIVHFGMNRDSFEKSMIGLPFYTVFYGIVYCFCISVPYGLLQMAVVLAIPLLGLYNGQRGSWKGMKWLFYTYYPVHLVICGIIRLIITN